MHKYAWNPLNILQIFANYLFRNSHTEIRQESAEDLKTIQCISPQIIR